ncbi:MAG: hypothetical protein QOE35_3495 [Actinomycetota bacterium]
MLGLAVSRGDWRAAPALDARAATSDDFDDAPSGSPLHESNGHWYVAAGAWVTMGGSARVIGPGQGLALALVDQPTPNGFVEVRLGTVADNCGITFRYRDERNYWAFVGAPTYGTWNVERVVDGQTLFVANTGPTPIIDGTVITVRMIGNSLVFLVDHRVRARAQDDSFPSAGTVGLIGRGPLLSDARWDDFVVSTDAAHG